ncbi:hypothetical protein MACK_004177 (apicoplast) [Theileria orientalis]|uniref:Uncharacterized protein n=1 Tax=Theileria orientalis TaxID=68886 RepID=A0A976SI53_THEOR|nr:hypothetical protein MACK_004177 [Theileria orientalis]
MTNKNQHSIILLKEINKNKSNYISDLINFIKEAIKLVIIIHNNSKNNINILKNKLLFTVKFLKLLIIYLIEKYYYNFNFLYFIKKASRDRNIFNFFVELNRLKEKLNFTKKEDKPYVRLMCFYIIMLGFYLLLGPFSWFLIRVLTDPQNWFEYHLEQISLTNLL